MSLGPHANFIIAAYLVAAAVIGALVAWVVFDYRAQKSALAGLDDRAGNRRSRQSRPANAEPA